MTEEVSIHAIQRGDYVTARLSGGGDWMTGVVLRVVGQQIDVRSPLYSARCDLQGAHHSAIWTWPPEEDQRPFVRSVRHEIMAGLVPD